MLLPIFTAAYLTTVLYTQINTPTQRQTHLNTFLQIVLRFLRIFTETFLRMWSVIFGYMRHSTVIFMWMCSVVYWYFRLIPSAIMKIMKKTSNRRFNHL